MRGIIVARLKGRNQGPINTINGGGVSLLTADLLAAMCEAPLSPAELRRVSQPPVLGGLSQRVSVESHWELEQQSKYHIFEVSFVNHVALTPQIGVLGHLLRGLSHHSSASELYLGPECEGPAMRFQSRGTLLGRLRGVMETPFIFLWNRHI